MDNGTVAFIKMKASINFDPPNGLQTFVITAAMDKVVQPQSMYLILVKDRGHLLLLLITKHFVHQNRHPFPTVRIILTLYLEQQTRKSSRLQDWLFLLTLSKPRSVSQSHYLADTVRSVSNTISPDSTAAESSYPSYITSSNSDGYTIGTGDFTSGTTIVAWTWDGGNLVTTSDTTNYNQDQTWSDLVTGTLETTYGNSSPAAPFNGYISIFDGTRPTAGNYLSMNFGTTFSSATSVKIYGHASLDGGTYTGANENLKINGTAIGVPLGLALDNQALL